MKFPFISRQFLFFLLFAALLCLPSPYVSAESQIPPAPDKALSVKMLRFGQQSYERGKYLDAKEYFRKAIQADPAFTIAWRYYDLATLFALAGKVEKNADLIAPDVSPRQEAGRGKSAPSTPSPPRAAPAKKKTFVIEQDEGC
jgi:tetratricopeptide (TPR) repeat protein